MGVDIMVSHYASATSDYIPIPIQSIVFQLWYIRDPHTCVIVLWYNPSNVSAFAWGHGWLNANLYDVVCWQRNFLRICAGWNKCLWPAMKRLTNWFLIEIMEFYEHVHKYEQWRLGSLLLDSIRKLRF